MTKINIVVAAQTNSAIKGLNQVTQATKRTGDSVQMAQKRLKSFGGETSRATMMTRKFAMGGLQQAGYQIGDYAVQVANGTSKMQAFGQQAPQLLQIFGPIGAVVGAGVAIFAAFGVALQKSGKEMTNFGAALGVLEQPLTSVVNSVKALGGMFGSVMPVVLNNIDTALIAAGLFASVIGVKMVASMIRAAGASKIMIAAMANVRAAVLASALSAGRFTTATVAMRSATLLLGGALKAVGAIFMRFLPIAVLVGIAKFIQMVLNARKSVGSFGAVFSMLKDIAVEVFERMRMGFALLSEEIFLASERMKDFFGMASMSAADMDAFRKSLNSSWQGLAGGLDSWEAFMSAVRDGKTDFELFGSSTSEATDKASSLAGKVNKELSPAMKRLKIVQDTVSSSFESGFMSMIDGTKSVKDAFKSMASEIIKELYRIFVVKKITGMISNAIGGFGSAAPASSLRPVARPTSFSGGGYTGNGARAGGLDGKGGFMAMMHPRETVVDHTKGQSAGGVTVIQNNTFQSGVTRSEVSALLPRMVEASKAAVLDAKRQGGSYGKAFA